jgi:splicing factor 3B subunit 5
MLAVHELTCSEWLTHQHRDTLASIVGHPPLLAYISIADGECLARERFEVIEVSYSFIFYSGSS